MTCDDTTSSDEFRAALTAAEGEKKLELKELQKAQLDAAMAELPARLTAAQEAAAVAATAATEAAAAVARMAADRDKITVETAAVIAAIHRHKNELLSIS